MTDLVFMGAGRRRGRRSALACGRRRRSHPQGGPDDEDGVNTADLAQIVTTLPLRVRVNVTNNSANPARLYGWVDFNRNGRFEQFELAQLDVQYTVNANVVLDFGNAPDTGVRDVVTSFARFRLSTNLAVAGMPTGAAGDGEVEDYPVTILPRPLVVDPKPRFTTLYAQGEDKVLTRQDSGDPNARGAPAQPG
ncbi:MAG: GEVED domain-containing protein [Caldilineaceae bacterium]